MYINLFNENLKPKHHFLIHYPRIIKLIGPVSLLSSMRFEAKHKELKIIASSTRSRKNIPTTLANRIQLQACYRYISKTDFVDSINMSAPYEINTEDVFFKDFENELSKKYYCVYWYQQNGIIYYKNCVLHYNNDLNIPGFAKVEHILIHTDSENKLFYCRIYKTLLYDFHYSAYLVEQQNTSLLVSFSSMYAKCPTIERVLPSGIYVTLPKLLNVEIINI